MNTNNNESFRTTFKEWVRQYKPIKNDLIEIVDDTPFEGYMFDTHGPERDRVRARSQWNIWTLIEAEGKQVIVQGERFVNRLGYFITEVREMRYVEVTL